MDEQETRYIWVHVTITGERPKSFQVQGDSGRLAWVPKGQIMTPGRFQAGQETWMLVTRWWIDTSRNEHLLAAPAWLADAESHLDAIVRKDR
jgi:hypothetical protein